MKVIIIIIIGFCCVALLPSNIHSADEDESFQTLFSELHRNAEMGKNGTLINGIFRLSKNGFLGKGSFSLTYKGTFEGTMAYNGKQVAIKFTPLKYRGNAAREYEIYTYLYAIDNPNTEKFGVPVVYYFDRNGEYLLMAITLLEPTFNEKFNNFEVSVVDMLITFREFTRITKYIHSCGVRHDDIKTNNVMYRKHQAFIIDFNVAHKTSQTSFAGTLKYLPRHVHLKEIRIAKDDWESFLYSMCYSAGIKLDWFDINDTTVVGQLKQNTTDTLRQIERVQNSPLRNVFLLFAKYLLYDNNYNSRNGFPAYNLFYRNFQNQINTFDVSQPALVSWLTPEERIKALQELADPTLDISLIKQPVLLDDTDYPKVDFFHFRRQYSSAYKRGETSGNS